jgi:hypothetical protein
MFFVPVKYLIRFLPNFSVNTTPLNSKTTVYKFLKILCVKSEILICALALDLFINWS